MFNGGGIDKRYTDKGNTDRVMSPLKISDLDKTQNDDTFYGEEQIQFQLLLEI